MSEKDVLQLLELFGQNNIEVHVDGGWGVDALLGRQTREHDDFDIAVEHKDLPKLRRLLEERGYHHQPRNDDQDYMFVMADAAGHKVDIHAYAFDDAGKLTYGVAYPFDSLKGTGIIGGQPVKCIAAEWVVKFHSAYEPDEKDYHDIKLLCEKFNIPLPEKYKRFETTSFDEI